MHLKFVNLFTIENIYIYYIYKYNFSSQKLLLIIKYNRFMYKISSKIININ